MILEVLLESRGRSQAREGLLWVCLTGDGSVSYRQIAQSLEGREERRVEDREGERRIEGGREEGEGGLRPESKLKRRQRT